MKNITHGMPLAASEYLLAGNPITRLEGLLFFGVQNLPDVIAGLRKQGWIVKSQRVPYAKALRRVNELAVLEPPKNLPVNEIQLTEYWISE